MNRSIILVTLIALVVAVLVATVVSKTLGGKSGDTEGADVSTTQILVAANRLKMGHEISEDDVKWMAWPDNAMFDGVIKRKSKGDKDAEKDDVDSKDDEKSAKLEPGMNKVVGKLAMRVVMKNEPITKDMVVDGNKNNFMAATLGEGMRAIAIKIKADSQAGGFIKAGDHVDVIMSYQLKNRGGAEMSAIASRIVSETVLSNVRILAIDQRAETSANNTGGDDDKKKKKGGGSGARVGKTATLELTKKQAEKLVIAKRMGSLTLVLRRFGEEDGPEAGRQIEFTSDLETADVLRLQSSLAGGGDPSSTVRVYNGSQVNEVKVRGQVSIPNQQSTDN